MNHSWIYFSIIIAFIFKSPLVIYCFDDWINYLIIYCIKYFFIECLFIALIIWLILVRTQLFNQLVLISEFVRTYIWCNWARIYVRRKSQGFLWIGTVHHTYGSYFYRKVAFAFLLMGLNCFDTLCHSDKQSHKILIERFIDDLLIYGIWQTGHWINSPKIEYVCMTLL